MKDRSQKAPYTPTPEQIAQAAAEIRDGWSASEEARRTQGPARQRWELPTFGGEGGRGKGELKGPSE